MAITREHIISISQAKVIEGKYNFDDLTSEERVYCFVWATNKKRIGSYWAFFHGEINLENFIQRMDSKKKTFKVFVEPAAKPMERNKNIPYHVGIKQNDALVIKVKQMTVYHRNLGDFIASEEFSSLDKIVRDKMDREYMLIRMWTLMNIIG